jgi:transcriptional regulator with XRE-family HTH domain
LTFYERYAAVAEKSGLKPGSEKAASLFGSNKSTVSKWKTNNITPIGNVVAAIADAFNVSTDYLLGRTDDMTDYAKGAKPAPEKSTLSPGVIQFPNDESDSLIRLIKRLDPADHLRAEGVIQGLLMQSKYNPAPSSLPNAAHIRTDVSVTPDMIAHDEGIMNGDDF